MRLASLAVAATIALTFSGCATSSQSIDEACDLMQDPLAEVATVLQETSDNFQSDPEAVVEAWGQLAITFGKLTVTVTNAEVKTALEEARDRTAEVGELIGKAASGDSSVEEAFEKARTGMTESFGKLAGLCSDQ